MQCGCELTISLMLGYDNQRLSYYIYNKIISKHFSRQNNPYNAIFCLIF